MGSRPKLPTLSWSFLSRPDDATQIIEACLSSGARVGLLYADNLTYVFFDLSSGDASAVLQKLRNYWLTKSRRGRCAMAYNARPNPCPSPVGPDRQR